RIRNSHSRDPSPAIRNERRLWISDGRRNGRRRQYGTNDGQRTDGWPIWNVWP
ncbi:hypothetical protein LPJ59_007019, partial [Coemansia sp. RSA 2399]